MAIIITICILLLLAYIFDISASKTKIPSVLLLLLLGWGVKQVTTALHIQIPNLSPILPILGTIGLILIVLEGSLELELNRTKYKLIGKSFFLAIIPMVILSFGLSWVFQYYTHTSLKIGLANAIPLTIISSAIAIPSVMHISHKEKEFITYESSLSDIFGVILFNFITLHEIIGLGTVAYFFVDLLFIIAISTIATIALTLLLSKIKHHVKFVPIILLIVLIYIVSKYYHLPALVLILFFGLFLCNIKRLTRFPLFNRLHTEMLEKEVTRFSELTNESSFLIRSLFFLLFGYLIETQDLLNLNTIVWAGAITSGIFAIRTIALFVMKLPIYPLLFIAPRGLITILLFLSIPIGQNIELVNRSLVLQIIILTSLIMIFGLMKKGNPTIKNTSNHERE